VKEEKKLMGKCEVVVFNDSDTTEGPKGRVIQASG
jgi:hypothetical protein